MVVEFPRLEKMTFGLFKRVTFLEYDGQVLERVREETLASALPSAPTLDDATLYNLHSLKLPVLPERDGEVLPQLQRPNVVRTERALRDGDGLAVQAITRRCSRS